MRNALVAVGAKAANVMEAWRIFEHYGFYYEGETWEVLAIEELAAVDVYSCRYDLIVRIPEGNLLFSPGVYIVDHKTSSRFATVVTECWQHHGEIIGQQWLYKQCGLEEKYGPLEGSIINLCGRQKNPEYRRILVEVKESSLAYFKEYVIDDNYVYMALAKKLYEDEGIVDEAYCKQLTSCTAHFGVCPHYSECWS